VAITAGFWFVVELILYLKGTPGIGGVVLGVKILDATTGRVASPFKLIGFAIMSYICIFPLFWPLAMPCCGCCGRQGTQTCLENAFNVILVEHASFKYSLKKPVNLLNT